MESYSPLPNQLTAEKKIISDVERVLRPYLVQIPQGKRIPPEAELAEMGLDSMNAIALLLELEGAFSITFPDSLLKASTFYSLATLANSIQSLIR